MKEKDNNFSELEDCDGSYETDLKSWSAEILII